MLGYFPDKSGLSVYFTVKSYSLSRVPAVIFIKNFLGKGHVKVIFKKIIIKLPVSDFLKNYFISLEGMLWLRVDPLKIFQTGISNILN